MEVFADGLLYVPNVMEIRLNDPLTIQLIKGMSENFWKNYRATDGTNIAKQISKRLLYMNM